MAKQQRSKALEAMLTIVVCIAWLMVLFLPVSAQVQVGVQAAMMVVLGSYFGLQIFAHHRGGSRYQHHEGSERRQYEYHNDNDDDRP
jgi:hypothetical protein